MKKQALKQAFTLIELIVVIAILSLLAAVAVPSMMDSIHQSQLSVDLANLRTLNAMTRFYAINETEQSSDIFAGLNSDTVRMQALVDEGFLKSPIETQVNEHSFRWLVDQQVWSLYDGETLVPLSPLGSTFIEISTAMIVKIQERFSSAGQYGRSWGDFAYTDIGLDPSDWQAAVNHVLYKPGGSQLSIRPEAGYRFVVEDVNGTTRTLTHALNWNLVYSDLDQQWYYHSISPSNRININTLQILE